MPVHPELAHLRARKAALHGRDPEDHELTATRRELAAAKIRHYIDRVLAEAPPLTNEQRSKLAELLRPVRASGASAPDSAA
ncbi:MAG: hypothetical protein WBA50_10725 [Mycobacterium sp.]